MNAKQKIRHIKIAKYSGLVHWNRKILVKYKADPKIYLRLYGRNIARLLHLDQPHDDVTNSIRIRKIFNAHILKSKKPVVAK